MLEKSDINKQLFALNSEQATHGGPTQNNAVFISTRTNIEPLIERHFCFRPFWGIPKQES
jgi:hypothetical protein